jgi:hypothetical protein
LREKQGRGHTVAATTAEGPVMKLLLRSTLSGRWFLPLAQGLMGLIVGLLLVWPTARAATPEAPAPAPYGWGSAK